MICSSLIKFMFMPFTYTPLTRLLARSFCPSCRVMRNNKFLYWQNEHRIKELSNFNSLHEAIFGRRKNKEKVFVSHFADSPENYIEAKTESWNCNMSHSVVGWIGRERDRPQLILSSVALLSVLASPLLDFSLNRSHVRARLQNHCTAFDRLLSN